MLSVAASGNLSGSLLRAARAHVSVRDADREYYFVHGAPTRQASMTSQQHHSRELVQRCCTPASQRETAAKQQRNKASPEKARPALNVECENARLGAAPCGGEVRALRDRDVACRESMCVSHALGIARAQKESCGKERGTRAVA